MSHPRPQEPSHLPYSHNKSTSDDSYEQVEKIRVVDPKQSTAHDKNYYQEAFGHTQTSNTKMQSPYHFATPDKYSSTTSIPMDRVDSQSTFGPGHRSESRTHLNTSFSEAYPPRREKEESSSSTPPRRATNPYGTLSEAQAYRNPTVSNPNLVFAEGDEPIPASNRFSRFIAHVLHTSFVIRWIIYVLPFLALLWIPGVVGVTAKPDATVWDTRLVWWSAWLTVVWVGWWVCAFCARMGPTLLKNTLGVVAPELRHYISYVRTVQFYAGAAGWALLNLITFQPLIQRRAIDDAAAFTRSMIRKGLLGIWISLAILLVEKVLIQVIAHNFHKKSYQDRISEQKFQIRVLIALYLSSRDIGRVDTLDGYGMPTARPKYGRKGSDPTFLVKKAVQSAKRVAQTATTVIGTVASEIAGERVLQPNSPSSVVLLTLGSTSKTKQLARRIFYSYCPKGQNSLRMQDISKCFENKEVTERAFTMFDRDENGDVTLDELEMCCLEIHRERIALSSSMRDVDSAVGKLDQILIGLWYIIAILIMAGLLNQSFATMIASAGSLILGLSWLIGLTAQEVLASIIFLFIKHAYDVGDRVNIEGESYTVLEMTLLATVFKRTDGMIVQAPHSVLNTKFIQNVRRSGPISETFTWDVSFDTPFEKIEELRTTMLGFLEVEKRDFIPQIDISIVNYDQQLKLSLSADIKYKSNWQNGALKTQRRNKWICSLKLAMAELQIWGPANNGNPDKITPPVEYTLVPYEKIEQEKLEKEKEKEKVKDESEPELQYVDPSGADLKRGRSMRPVEFADPNTAIDAEAGEIEKEERRRLRKGQ